LVLTGCGEGRGRVGVDDATWFGGGSSPLRSCCPSSSFPPSPCHDRGCDAKAMQCNATHPGVDIKARLAVGETVVEAPELGPLALALLHLLVVLEVSKLLFLFLFLGVWWVGGWMGWGGGMGVVLMVPCRDVNVIVTDRSTHAVRAPLSCIHVLALPGDDFDRSIPLIYPHPLTHTHTPTPTHTHRPTSHTHANR
jgi:hypothetical protein